MGLQRFWTWLGACTHTHTNTHTSGALSVYSFSTKASVRYFLWSDPEWITVVVFSITFERFLLNPGLFLTCMWRSVTKLKNLRSPEDLWSCCSPFPLLLFSPSRYSTLQTLLTLVLLKSWVLFPQVKDSVKLHVITPFLYRWKILQAASWGNLRDHFIYSVLPRLILASLISFEPCFFSLFPLPSP